VPTYDYRCKACGQDLEVFQSFTDEPLTTCEACGGELRKLFGAPGIAFKGSGFYKTDSRSGSRKSSSSTDKVSADKGSSDKSSSDKGSSSSDASSNGSGSSKKEPAASSSSKTDAS
jgi:putative FmdB family regulatory protein